MNLYVFTEIDEFAVMNWLQIHEFFSCYNELAIVRRHPYMVKFGNFGF